MYDWFIDEINICPHTWSYYFDAGIKLFQCHICAVRFSSNVALREHVARHANLQPHRCDTCGRSFRQVSSFRRHVATHSSATTVDRHLCEVCQESFTTAVYLRSHLRSHTGSTFCTLIWDWWWPMCKKFLKPLEVKFETIFVNVIECKWLFSIWSRFCPCPPLGEPAYDSVTVFLTPTGPTEQ